MRLRSIRLHPFGRFTDRSWDLAQQLVVIHGPNELGKSTLRQAIVHTLFTPTNLTPGRFKETVQPWLPLPGGDHAQVELTFEHGGSTWTLGKRWGAGQASRLSDGTTTVADPKKVQSLLGDMLGHGEATFTHVLFTGQAELEQTLQTIEKNAADIRDVRDLLKAGAAAAADVDEQRLRRAVNERIDKAFGRWNDDRGRPERQSGQEKVLANRWINGVGTILKAWYAWQDVVAEQDDVLAIEREIDGVSREVGEAEGRLAAATGFVATYGPLRADLHERSLLDERVGRLTEQAATLAEIYRNWPRAEDAIAEWGRRGSELDERHRKLQAELATAKKRSEGAAVRASFGRLESAKQAWEQAEADAGRLPDPGPERSATIRRLEAAITAAEAVLAARSLSWRIESRGTSDVTIERGRGPGEMLPVGPAGLSGTAEARVRMVAGDITLTVDSGGDDVDAMFAALAADRERLARELQACNAPTAADVAIMAEKRRDAAARAAERKASYEGALGGRSFDELAAAIKGLDGLAATRDVTTIESELEQVRSGLAAGKSRAEEHQKAIDGWKQSHTDRDALEDRLLETKRTLKEAEAARAALATLPEEFDTPKTLIEKLDAAQADQLAIQRLLTEKQGKFVELTIRLGERRSQELAERAEAAERRFARARTEGRAYLRIRQELERIAADAGEDPLRAFGDRVASMFSRITGGAATLEFAGQLPAQVVRGPVALPPDRLSHGGGGALALAVRLAMAEAYLAHGGGFLMLDDPFVHFDPGRMAIAAALLRECAEKAQVLFFTCHDHHAAQLVPGKDPAVT
jgi:DNA repair exonuclease SbcCD ATPase subunit